MSLLDGPEIKLISLDLDGTLWDLWPTIGRAEEVLHGWLGERYPAITEAHSPKELRLLNRVASQDRPEIQHDVSALRKAGLTYAAERAGYEADFIEEAYEIFLEARNQVKLFEGAERLLQQLSPRFQVAATTNGNADVHRIGIGEHFHVNLTAGKAGAMKPDPQIFHELERISGVPLENMVHVGDELPSDIAGANAAGIRSVWYNPEATPNPDGPQPTVEIRSLSQLPIELGIV